MIPVIVDPRQVRMALVGRGQWQADDMRRALEARNRAALGFNAPPEGLYFVEAIYP